RSRLGLEPAVPLIGSVARLVPQKAPLDYVRACAGVARECADAHFVLIGSGPLESAVDKEVLRLGLSRRFHQLPVLPAAAAVLGDLVGNRDTIEHGTSGFLVPEGDVDGYATAILALLRDDDLRARLGAAG